MHAAPSTSRPGISGRAANAAAASSSLLLRHRRCRPRTAAAAASSDAPTTTPSPPLPRIEFPPATVVSKADGYDLRLYQPYPVVRTEYEARPPAFLSLGEYLGGANATKTRFARPEPAIMRQGLPGGKKTMELYIGSRRASGAEEESDNNNTTSSTDSPPAPDDPSLTIDVSGGELVAVGVFGGNLTREAAEGAHAALRQALNRDGLEAADAEGVYRACQYGAIHSLGERRNEIWVRVKL
jgi:hypothetical protein